MFIRPEKQPKRSSRATVSTHRAAKHSSSEPSTPAPRAPRLPSLTAEDFTHALQNISIESGDTLSSVNSFGSHSNPLPIPLRSYVSLQSFMTASAEMKMPSSATANSPSTSNTTESFLSVEGNESRLAVNSSPSPKEPASPVSEKMNDASDSSDDFTPLEILSSDDESLEEQRKTKKRTSRSIFSSTPSPEPVLPRSEPINIPSPTFKRSKSLS